ncbi:MAG TPA: DUF3987 domain-containing protein, partial [Pyrinomonadaceae bacterium]|nr:DUF3987 domain-containing protein [Pyrinomonadaceae bacterium]
FALKDGTEMRQSAVFSYASELSIFLGEVFGSISELLTTFYDCAPNDWRKPWIYENKGEGEIRIHGPCLNILGASTSAWLIRCIPPSEMEGGFSSRVIFVVEKDPPQKLVAWPEIDHASEGVRKKLIEDLTRINELVGSMAVTPDAKDWYTKYYNEQRTALMKATDLRFSGYYGRKTSTILKVAMCLSVADSDSLVIEEKHMREAQRLLDDLEVNMFDAFGASGDNASSPILRKIWTTIKRENEISHAELLRIHWRDVDHRDLIGLMETLNNMGAIRVFKQGSKVIYTPSDKEVRL